MKVRLELDFGELCLLSDGLHDRVHLLERQGTGEEEDKARELARFVESILFVL